MGSLPSPVAHKEHEVFLPFVQRWSDVLATPDESAMPSQTIVASDYEWAMTKNTLLFIRGFFHNGCVE